MKTEAPINILIITERFWPEYTGWIKQTLSMAAACGPSFQFTALARRQALGGASEQAAGEELPENVFLRRVAPSLGQGGFASQMRFVARACVYFVRRRRDVDVLYLPYTYFPAFIFMALARWLGVPVVARISGQEVAPNPSVAARLRFRALRWAQAVVALNEADAGRLEELGVDVARVLRIPNGVNPDRFVLPTAAERRRQKRALGMPEDALLIAFAGIVCPRKGVAELLAAYEQLGEQEPAPHLLIAGPLKGVTEVETAYVEQVRQCVEALGPRVRLLGRLDGIDELLQASDVFVLPSFAEGMPNVLIEAMATGLPCVATDIPGVRDVLEEGRNGLLVPPGEAGPLAHALHTLLDDSSKRQRLGAAARQTVEERLSIAHTAAQYARVFRQVAQKRGPRDRRAEG